MGSGYDEPDEFATFLEEAKQYDGFEESSDDDTPEEQVTDAGEPESQDEGEEGFEPGEATDDDEPVYEVTLPGGAKVTVPLEELLAGYSRTADYTRKTQALAADRRRLADAEALAQALERNPAQAIAAIARAYGVDGTAGESEEYLSDDDRWRRSVESELAEARRAKQEAQIEREITRLHGAYGDFDEELLFNHAVQTGTRDLETALQALLFGQGRQARQAQAVKRTSAKRAAAAAQGSRPAAASRPVVDDSEILTFQDAYQYAKRMRDQRS